jgi:hypothetical protein
MRRAFVVQVRAGTPGGGDLAGRVEHVLSGKAQHFESVQELISFVHRMIRIEDRAREPAGEAEQNPP